MCVYIYTHTYIYNVYVYIYTHTYKHTHTHSLSPSIVPAADARDERVDIYIYISGESVGGCGCLRVCVHI